MAHTRIQHRDEKAPSLSGAGAKVRPQPECAALIGWLLLGIFLAVPALQAQEEEARIKRVAEQLISIVADADKRFSVPSRVQAAISLGNMGSDARTVVPAIINVLQDRQRAFPELLNDKFYEAVGRIGAPAREAIPALVANAGTDPQTDRIIAEAVLAIQRAPDGPGDLPGLLQQLQDRDPAIRLRAAKSMTLLGPDARNGLPTLLQLVNDPDGDVRRQMLQAILAIRPGIPPTDNMIAAYVRDLQDPSEGVRLQTIKALARFGSLASRALPALQAVAKNDVDLDVRRVAGEALFRIQGGPGFQ